MGTVVQGGQQTPNPGTTGRGLIPRRALVIDEGEIELAKYHTIWLGVVALTLLVETLIVTSFVAMTTGVVANTIVALYG